MASLCLWVTPRRMNTKKHSKRLSYILRHAPEEAGLSLGEGGWVLVADLLKGLSTKGWAIDRALLQEVVDTNDKKRFTISEDGLRIRAAQGHSVEIVSDLVPRSPPEELFHGTATRFLDSIMTQGLRSMSRQHVHLSSDQSTARTVGARHGKPVILQIAAAQMTNDGLVFYRADNGVWLTDAVEAKYLSFSAK